MQRRACSFVLRRVVVSSMPGRLIHPWSRSFAGLAGVAAEPKSARELLRPPGVDGGPVELSAECGLNLELQGVPTVSVIGPSRRGKSVLASLLAGGTPGLFAQSHSSYKSMTSGTHVCEVQASKGGPLRIIDTEGLSHVGRSRKNEALVRQFLISTYLTSSWVVWLDTEVLSSGFFNTMWLVHDYVVDVLRIHEGSGHNLPGLVYIRTQETEVQRREYQDEFNDFGSFFSRVLEEHEDAHILTQMFDPAKIRGHSLPLWTVEDLDHFESSQFWHAGHSSPFKDAVASLCGALEAPVGEVAAEEASSPPLLALDALPNYLPKISRLEKFDPRDHEGNKVARLRAQLRGAYGSPLRSALWLADLFDPEDRDVEEHDFRIDALAKTRIKGVCESLRLDMEIAEEDHEVISVMERFSLAADIFAIAREHFASEDFSEKKILLRAIHGWRLDADELAAELWASLAEAEERFLTASGLPRGSLKDLRMHTKLKWRIEDAIVQLRGRAASDLRLRKEGAKNEFENTTVWRLGEWSGLVRKRGPVSQLNRPKYSLWTDGAAWKLYEEKWLRQRDGPGFPIGELFEQGCLRAEDGLLPVP